MFQDIVNRASRCLANEMPFVLYSKPNSRRLNAIFQKDSAVHVTDEFTETGFIFAPFDGTSKAILLHGDELMNAPLNLEAFPFASEDNKLIVDLSGKSQHLDLISKALGELQQGRLEKVVLSRKIEVECTNAPSVLFQRVLKRYPTAFCYFWYHPNVGMWMGATPEILIKSKGLEFTTMSLAGTQSSLQFEKPQWTKKEFKEQLMVTDYIQEALKQVDVSSKRAEVESIRAGNLWHLRTQLKGTFAPNGFGQVLKAIHPTPAVCGIPLKEAGKFIIENECYDRSFYTGFLGELNFKCEVPRNKNKRNQENSAYRGLVNKSELFVNLRCMQLQRESAEIYVGGGITIDSNPETEWEETVSKSGTMLRILNDK